jgi:hypothetical protein
MRLSILTFVLAMIVTPITAFAAEVASLVATCSSYRSDIFHSFLRG